MHRLQTASQLPFGLCHCKFRRSAVYSDDRKQDTGFRQGGGPYGGFKRKRARAQVAMNNRRNCAIGGVNDVLSFDIHEILLETEQGMLMIKGDELHVSRLTLEKGEVDIDGRIDSLTYSDAGAGSRKGESLLTRLFR